MEPDRPGQTSPGASRLLSAGARRAEQIAHITGVDRAVDQAMEEAIVRALRSPGVRRALVRALEQEDFAGELDPNEVARLARRVLDSGAAERVWAEVLASDHAQMLVERIARAPEVRAAIAAQGAGLITDAGIRLSKLTEELDDALERFFRRHDPDAEQDQAGLATRLVAAIVDLGLLASLHAVASAAFASLVPFLFGPHTTVARAITLGALGVLATGFYLVTFWVLAGQTPGMRFLSIRLLEHGSREVTLRCALRRVFALLVSALPLGLGFLAILRNPSRRAWHDRLVGTEVVYDMTSRVAPHSGTVTPAPRGGLERRRPPGNA